MKLVLGDYSSRLEDVQREDIWYKNLAAAKRRPEQKFDSKPQIGIRLDKYPEMAELFRERGVKIVEFPDSKDPSVLHHCIELRAYPKMREKRFGSGLEQVPKIVVKSTEETKRLKQRHFGICFDAVSLKNVIIDFAWYDSDGSNYVIPAINAIWAEIDQSGGGFNQAEIDRRYGYSEENEDENADPDEEYDEEDVPFN